MNELLQKDNDKVSIVMPIYNVEQYIKDCIYSIIRQTYKNIEVILVDDGSPDNAPDIAFGILSKNNINTRLIHQKNLGQYAARNTGEEIASGDYIIFLDSDDIISSDFVERQLLAIKNKQSVMSITDYQNITVTNKFVSPEYDLGVEYLDKKTIQERYLFRDIKITASGSIFLLSWYRENGLKFPNIRFGEDTLFIWSALLKAPCVAHIQSPIYYYLYHPNSVMTSTKYERIVAAHYAYKEVANLYQSQKDCSPVVQKYLYPRYVLATLHSGSKLINFSEFIKLFNALDARRYLKKLLTFPEKKIRILAVTGLLSKKALFWICKQK